MIRQHYTYQGQLKLKTKANQLTRLIVNPAFMMSLQLQEDLFIALWLLPIPPHTEEFCALRSFDTFFVEIHVLGVKVDG